MGKKLGRILSAVLAVVIFAASLSPAVSLAAPSKDEIVKQIKTTYKKALSLFGKSSFDGYCGSLVNAQLYLLGITDRIVNNNGNQEYDEYCHQDVTSGGYRVTAYPASRYSLREALMEITDGGTRDAYNILVGFEKTKSVAGQRYGHALVIHGIFDGMVYFVESYDVRLNGSNYPEGTPLICSIDDFCTYYAYSVREYDGVVEFGLKSYEDQCDRFSSCLTAQVTAATQLMSLPCGAQTHAGSQAVSDLAAGEELQVIGMYCNTEGEYWYETAGGYLPCESVAVQAMGFDDVVLKEAVAPIVLRKSAGFKVKGKISAQHNTIYTLRAQVTRLEGREEIQALSVIDSVEGRSYSLADSQISKKLKFRDLEAGRYRYTLAAIVGNHYYGDGQLQVSWDTVELWKSEFQVSENKTGSFTVSFDAGDGLADWGQTAVIKGQPLEELPAAQREGYAFLGWYTDAGNAISADYAPTGDLTLHARWYSLDQLNSQWQSSGSGMISTIGLTTQGCVEVEGKRYYFSSFGGGWVVLNEDGTVVY